MYTYICMEILVTKEGQNISVLYALAEKEKADLVQIICKLHSY